MSCTHTDRPAYARGQCRSCYEKDLRGRNPDFAERQRQNNCQWREARPEYRWDKAKTDEKNLARRVRGRAILRAKLAAQEGRCEICQTPKATRWHYDHNHETGELRGVLCSKCNNGLGMFGDSSAMLRRAADYLDTHDFAPTGLKAALYRGHNRRRPQHVAA